MMHLVRVVVVVAVKVDTRGSGDGTHRHGGTSGSEMVGSSDGESMSSREGLQPSGHAQ